MGTGASVNNNENNATEQSLLLATYQLLPEYKFCQTHSCYAPGDALLGNIPEPSPPPSRKSDIFDPAYYTEIDKKACKVDATFMQQSVPKLVRFLTKDLNDTLSKVRILFRWVTAQPLEQLSIQQSEPSHETMLYQLWRIKKQKGNYAQLFGLLCSHAHIPCIIISGQLKGSSYLIGESVEGNEHYGEWNAVLIDGSWRLLNVFWGTCTEGPEDGSNKKKLVYLCDDHYFLTDPDHFIYTHLPDEDRWQLLDRPISREDFNQQALLKDRFFDMDLKLNFPHECVVGVDNEVNISFDLPRETQLNLWFLALLSFNDDEPRRDLKRYVFVERIENHEIRIRVRNPGVGNYKLEIVGKDETTKEPGYNFDWIAIYKIVSETPAISPFPDCPLIGWGPGNLSMFQCGLTAVSHNVGKINTDTGLIEMRFKRSNMEKMKYFGELVKNGELNPIQNHVVHRVEDDELIFNVETPLSGEYAFKIQAINETGITTNICNYFIDSSQNKGNASFPSDLQDGLGAKLAMQEMNIDIVTPKSAFVISERKDIAFEFRKPSNVHLTALGSGDNPISTKTKILEQEKVVYKVKLGTSGNYCFRLRAVHEEGGLPQSVYDAVIKFTKQKEKKVVQHKERELKGLPDEIKHCIDKAVKNEDDEELERIIERIKLLTFSTKQEEIDQLQLEIELIRCRKELVSATISKKIPRMETALTSTYGKEYSPRLEKEIIALKAMLERTKKLARLLRDVMDLKQNVISEIKSYTKPPPVVHRIMIASLLLLGHSEEQTRNWLEVQKILGGTVRASIIRKVSKFDMDKISLKVERKAKEYVNDITLDDVRLISAGAATFYCWVKGVTEEMEKRRSEGFQGRPVTAGSNVNEQSEETDDAEKFSKVEAQYNVTGQADHAEMEGYYLEGGLNDPHLGDGDDKIQSEKNSILYSGIGTDDNDEEYHSVEKDQNSNGQNETGDLVGGNNICFKNQSETNDSNSGNTQEEDISNFNGEMKNNLDEDNGQSETDDDYSGCSWEDEDSNSNIQVETDENFKQNLDLNSHPETENQ